MTVGDIHEFATAGNHPVICREIAKPSSGKLVRLLNDDELPASLRKRSPEDTAPQTVTLITDKPTTNFTEAMQRFIFALNPGLTPSRFGHIIDTWNVTGKVRDCRNYITGERLTVDYPKYHSYLSMGGSVHMTTGEPFMRGNLKVYELLRINSNNPLPSPATLPEYYKIHLVIYAAGKVIEFPQRDGLPCYAALMGAVPIYIDERCVKVL